jgi:hypothetical protein
VILDLGRDATPTRPGRRSADNQTAPSRTSTGNLFSDQAPAVALTAPVVARRKAGYGFYR